jgi:DNA-binding NtrC family response regulator
MDEITGGTVTLDRPSGQMLHVLRVSVTRGPDRGQSVVIDGPSVLVGRASGVGLRLTDIAVSSFHVELAAAPSGVVVKDLSSHNGTYYAGARIERAVVPSGAVLEVGASTLEVELETELATPEAELASFGPLRGASHAMQAVFAVLSRVAKAELSVLLEGGPGTGKALAARALHEASRRADKPFVTLECATIPSGLGESMLLGRDGGDGARTPGVFEAADGGTLLLADVGRLSPELQTLLLRVLETRDVGTKTPRPVRVRVLASTRTDLRELVNASAFLEELYLRLAQARVVLPSLAERPDDVPVLTYHFLQNMPSDAECARTIAREALDELKRRDYRGSVRELRHTVERAAMVARGHTITSGDLAFERILSAERERATEGDSGELMPFKEAKRTLVDDFERDYLKALLLRAGDNLSRASALSGVERHHLRNLLRKHALGERS